MKHELIESPQQQKLCLTLGRGQQENSLESPLLQQVVPEGQEVVSSHFTESPLVN